MADYILVHSDSGKTFFVDKDEYLAHWEWKKPTKYTDKYKKNGKTVYVYENGYEDKKGVNNSKNYLKSTPNGPVYVHAIDLRDNTKKIGKINRSDVLAPKTEYIYESAIERGYRTKMHDRKTDMFKDDVYIDARTGKEISTSKVNFYATIGQLKDSIFSKIGSTWVGKKLGIEGIKDYTHYDKYTYDGGMEKRLEEQRHADALSSIMKTDKDLRQKARERSMDRIRREGINIDYIDPISHDFVDPKLSDELKDIQSLYDYLIRNENVEYMNNLEEIKQHTNKRK